MTDHLVAGSDDAGSPQGTPAAPTPEGSAKDKQKKADPKKNSTPKAGQKLELPLIRVPLVWILSGATMINVTLIVGGTWYGKIKLDSIDQSYADARRKINQATDAYMTAQATSRSQMQAASAAITQADAVSAQASKLDETLANVYRSSQSAQSKLDESVRGSLSSLANSFSVAATQLKADQEAHHQEISSAYSKAASDLKTAQTEQEKKFDEDRRKLLSDLNDAKKATADKLNGIDGEVTQLKLDAASHLLDVKKLENVAAEDLEKIRSGHQVDLKLIWRNTNWDVFVAALVSVALASGISAAVTARVLGKVRTDPPIQPLER